MPELMKLDDVCGDISLPATREKILELEAEIASYPQLEIPVIHRYSGGIYAREITIPAGAALTGTIYLDAHFDVMVSGRILTSGDSGMKDLSGFNIFKGNQGKKRAGYAIEDTRWITFHSSPELIEEMYLPHLTTETFEALDAEIADRSEIAIRRAFEAQVSYHKGDFPMFKAGYLAALGPSPQDDYNKMLKDCGLTEATVRAESEVIDDQIDIDTGPVYVAPSMIEGCGLFSKHSYLEGDLIIKARHEGKRTIAGRYTNHSNKPNARMAISGDDVVLVATKSINGDEITTDYRANLSVQGILKCQV